MKQSYTIKVGENTYTTKFPTMGQFIDINVLEAQLSKGTIKDLITSGTSDAIDTYVYLSMYAHISILFPQLVKDLKVNSLLDLDMNDCQELVERFVEVKSWIKDVKDSMHKEIAESHGKSE